MSGGLGDGDGWCIGRKKMTSRGEFQTGKKGKYICRKKRREATRLGARELGFDKLG